MINDFEAEPENSGQLPAEADGETLDEGVASPKSPSPLNAASSGSLPKVREQNRRNGKRAANQNAKTHGIFAQIVTRRSDLDDFEKLLSDAKQAIRPTNGLEEILVEKFAVELLRSRRFHEADIKIAPKLFSRLKESLNRAVPSIALVLASGAQNSVTGRDITLDLMIRYGTSIDRQIGRTLDQIQQLRRMREIDAKPALPDSEARDEQT